MDDDITREEVRALRPRFDWRLALPVAVSALAHGAAVLTASAALPSDRAHEENMALMQRLLAASAGADDPAEGDALDTASHRADRGDEGGMGTRAKGEEGKLSRSARASGAKYAVGGPSAGDPAERAAALREASAFGLIGLLGGGEGGGGRGAGGLGSIGTIGHGAGAGVRGSTWGDSVGGSGGLGLASSGGAAAQQGPGGVRAGEWDDNAAYREFQRLLATKAALGFLPLDVSERQFLVVRDSAGKPVPSCDVTVTDARGASTTLRTMSTGRAVLFPRGEGLAPGSLTATARCAGSSLGKQWVPATDAVVVLDAQEPRELRDVSIDLGFVLDTTGSMSEEIVAVQSTLRKVAASLKDRGVRVGLVEYKDRGDEYVTRVHPMDTDLDAFSARVSGLRASGGGDTPESVAAGLHDAIAKLEWRDAASARLLFVIGDAPPHLDYANEPDYRDDARAAARRGIQIHAVAASGMDELGQIVFRQLALYTAGTELFVLRGGAGPESTGGGDPLSSCGGTHDRYTSGNLDALILAHVEAARRAVDADPTAIRGRGADVTTPACARQ